MATVTLSERERAALLAHASTDPKLLDLGPNAVALAAELLAGLVIAEMLRDLLDGDPALTQAIRENAAKFRIAADVAALCGRRVEVVAG
jgi:hypothetical protein